MGKVGLRAEHARARRARIAKVLLSDPDVGAEALAERFGCSRCVIDSVAVELGIDLSRRRELTPAESTRGMGLVEEWDKRSWGKTGLVFRRKRAGKNRRRS